MSDGGFTITGPENMEMFRYLQIAAGLALEINTGMKLSSRGSVMLLAAQYCGSAKRTKRGVLKDFVAWLQNVRPDYEPNPRVLQAMNGK